MFFYYLFYGAIVAAVLWAILMVIRRIVNHAAIQVYNTKHDNQTSSWFFSSYEKHIQDTEEADQRAAEDEKLVEEELQKP